MSITTRAAWLSICLLLIFNIQVPLLAANSNNPEGRGTPTPRNALLNKPGTAPRLTGILAYDKELLLLATAPGTPAAPPTAIEIGSDEFIYFALAGVALLTFGITYMIKGNLKDSLKTFGGLLGSLALVTLMMCCVVGG